MKSYNDILDNYKNEKFDIIILAGQSNAQGCGIGSSREEYEPNDRILWLSDDANIHFEKDENKEDYLFIPEECKKTVKVAAERENADGGKIGNFALAFAKKYFDDGMLAEGRKLLIIDSAVGGTGFAKKQWGVGNPLYERLVDMTDAALKMNSENRLVAFLWHQGEHDAFENPQFSVIERHTFYLTSITLMYEDYCRRFGVSGLPFIAGEPCRDWYRKTNISCDTVMSATCDFIKAVGGGLVSSEGLLSNNQKTGNGDDIHFCRAALYTLGNRYYKKYKAIVKRK